MGVGKIVDVDVVANTCSVGGGIVVAENIERPTEAKYCFHY